MNITEFEAITEILTKESNLTAREIAKRASKMGFSWVRKDANSNLYRMLNQGLVYKNANSKVPTWTLVDSNELNAKVHFKEILSQPRKNSARSLKELVQEEDFSISLSTTQVRFAYDMNASSNDPYLKGDWLSDKLFITVNTQHPFWDTFIDTEDEKLLYLQFIAQDALIQWTIAKSGNAIGYKEIISLRDSVLREISHVKLLED